MEGETRGCRVGRKEALVWWCRQDVCGGGVQPDEDMRAGRGGDFGGRGLKHGRTETKGGGMGHGGKEAGKHLSNSMF